MANFNISHKNTGGFEGGYSNHPDDTGGETWAGIARKKNPQWEGWKIIDELKANETFPKNLKDSLLLKEKVHSFYKHNYWDTVWGDRLTSQSFANMIYGSAVNHGVSKAIRMYQISFSVGFTSLTEEEIKTKLQEKGIVYGQMNEKTLELFNGKA